jgi:ubiquinone biosynthesis protein UbiJ
MCYIQYIVYSIILFLQDLLTSIPNFSKYLPSLVGMVSSLHLHGLSSMFSVSKLQLISLIKQYSWVSNRVNVGQAA